MSRVASIAAAHRRAHHVPPLALAGFNIAYDGLAATAADLDDWDVADGTGDTVDLCSGVIPIGKDATYLGAGGDDLSNVSVSVDTQGGHTGASNPAQSRNSTANNLYTYARATAGGHTHTLLCENISYSPPHKPLIFIQANKDTQIPKDGVLWVDGSGAPTDYSAFADIQDRFIKGTSGDTRTVSGSDDMEFDLVSFSSNGPHDHTTTRNSASTPPYNSYDTYRDDGAHPHPDQTDETDEVTKPPFIALLGIKADRAAGAFFGLVGYYNGDLGDLSDGWYEGDGTNGTRDCRGRMILGVGTASLGETGGDMSNATVEAAIASLLVNHYHAVLSGQQSTELLGYHKAYNWYHGHLATAENIKQPKWHGLFTVYYLP